MPISPQRISGHDAHVVRTADMHLDLHGRGCLPGVTDILAHAGRELSSASWGRECASPVRKMCLFIHPNTSSISMMTRVWTPVYPICALV